MTYLLFTHSHRHTTRREEGRLPCPFLKIDKCLDFGGKCSDCVHIWVKFSIRNVVLIVSRRKKLQNVSLRGLCLFLCFWRNVCGHETFKNPIQTIQTYSCPIQTYSAIFKTLSSTCIFRTLPYSESWHIQNARYIQESVKAYSGIFRTLCNAGIWKTLSYSEVCHIQNLAYLGIFRHIQLW